MLDIRIMLKRLFHQPNVYRMTLLLVVYLTVGFMLTTQLVPDGVEIKVGQASLSFVGAPRNVQDRHTTEALRKSARQGVGNVYDQDNAVLPQILQRVDSLFDLFAKVSATLEPLPAQVAAVRADAPVSLTEQTIAVGLGVNEEVRSSLVAELRKVLEPLYQLGLKEDGLEPTRARVREALRDSTMRMEHRALLAAIVPPLMTHNLILNEEATLRAREAAANAVAPIFLQAGQKIIGQGEIATEREITILRDLGLLRSGFDYRVLAGVWILALLIVTFPVAYLYFHHRSIYNLTPQLALIAVICLGVSLIALPLAHVAGYLMPIATASMLITVLMGAKVGLGIGVAMSLLAAGFTNFEPRFFFVAIMGAVAGVYAVSNSELRRSLVRGGLVVGLVNALAVAAFALLLGGELQVALWDVFLALGNGLLSAVLTIGSLPFLESAFGVVSSIKLAELANPQQALLKRLLIEAPGTYHHSLIVANLAEAAAEQVGADALITRVGAYYHDIGKVERPYFFIENQVMADNPHDDYPPHLSALIIISHVKDGVRLAREHKLPGVIIDIIREHHGSSVAQYFYNKALKADQDTKEEDFCYEGPRPASKEAAIVMLADIVEAAVRAMTNPTLAKIEQRVRGLLRDKLYAGQLDACDLTLREIENIGSAFIHHLSGIFHRRVEYPEPQGGKMLDAGYMEQRTRTTLIAK
ncbi:MAG: Cyclic-di-AMP phosphodiesterase PgpH [Firmicutes bacterium]|nr:Cyclic-di-AMP phosphodiesterase PgpH [Bacillota bacterium]